VQSGSHSADERSAIIGEQNPRNSKPQSCKEVTKELLFRRLFLMGPNFAPLQLRVLAIFFIQPAICRT
jgi:hypothetical protein